MGANPGEWCADVFRPDFYGTATNNPLTGRIEPAGGHAARCECMCNRRWCTHEAFTRSRGDVSNIRFNLSFRCAVSIPEAAWIRRPAGD